MAKPWEGPPEMPLSPPCGVCSPKEEEEEDEEKKKEKANAKAEAKANGGTSTDSISVTEQRFDDGSSLRTYQNPDGTSSTYSSPRPAEPAGVTEQRFDDGSSLRTYHYDDGSSVSGASPSPPEQVGLPDRVIYDANSMTRAEVDVLRESLVNPNAQLTAPQRTAIENAIKTYESGRPDPLGDLEPNWEGPTDALPTDYG